jgi:hypothetical protein
MKTTFGMAWAAGLFSLLLLVGCTEESTPGGPGAANTTQSGEPANDDATFTIEMPTGATNIEQGKSETVKIGVDRGSDFTGDVSVTLVAPDGVTITPQQATIPSGSDDVEVAVQVAPTVPPGEKIINVTGSGGSGPPATGQLKIEVTQAEGDSPDGAAPPVDPTANPAPPADPANPDANAPAANPLNPAPPAIPANPEGGAPPQADPATPNP